MCVWLIKKASSRTYSNSVQRIGKEMLVPFIRHATETHFVYILYKLHNPEHHSQLIKLKIADVLPLIHQRTFQLSLQPALHVY